MARIRFARCGRPRRATGRNGSLGHGAPDDDGDAGADEAGDRVADPATERDAEQPEDQARQDRPDNAENDIADSTPPVFMNLLASQPARPPTMIAASQPTPSKPFFGPP
jgi:hypothetical protein